MERFHLKEQQRTKDVSHMNLLTRTSKGEKLHSSDLNIYKHLHPEDLQEPLVDSITNECKDPNTLWRYAPTLCSTNRERTDITHRKALLFAKETGTFLFRWKSDIKAWSNRPLLLNERLQITQNDPCFYQHFVMGADVTLTSNINCNLKLANGTHSLSFASEDELHKVEQQMQTLPPGSTITLENPPVAVNVTFPELQKQWNDSPANLTLADQAQCKLLSDLSLSSHEILIPLPVMRSGTKKRTVTILRSHDSKPEQCRGTTLAPWTWHASVDRVSVDKAGSQPGSLDPLTVLEKQGR